MGVRRGAKGAKKRARMKKRRWWRRRRMKCDRTTSTIGRISQALVSEYWIWPSCVLRASRCRRAISRIRLPSIPSGRKCMSAGGLLACVLACTQRGCIRTHGDVPVVALLVCGCASARNGSTCQSLVPVPLTYRELWHVCQSDGPRFCRWRKAVWGDGKFGRY